MSLTIEQVGRQCLEVLVLRELGHYLGMVGRGQAEHRRYAVQEPGPNQEVDHPVWNHLQHGKKRCSLRGELQENRESSLLEGLGLYRLPCRWYFSSVI